MDKSKKTDNLVYKVFLGAIGVVVLCGLSFYGGIHYEKGKRTTTGSQTAATGGQGGLGAGGFRSRFGGGQRPNFGTVTAVSATSITITSSQDNSSKTYSIDSSTQITDNGQTVTASDIQAGDSVVIRTSSTTSTVAMAILVNPSFGGGAAGGQSSI